MFENGHEQARFNRDAGTGKEDGYGLGLPARDVGAMRPVIVRQPARSVAKRLIDLAIGIPALILALPVMACIALVVWLTDGGAPIFVQRRYGKNGKTFRFFKFRSMRIDADQRLQALIDINPEAKAEWGVQRKLRRDPRITRFGEFIRTWSLGELPQLINIIRGDMSLVGPRPLVQHENPELDDRTLYGADFQYYLMARPGLTGLWQVSGRANTLFSDRVGMDIEYVRTWSISADLRILAQTLPVVIRRTGAH